jgi:hypothetical protein
MWTGYSSGYNPLYQWGSFFCCNISISYRHPPPLLPLSIAKVHSNCTRCQNLNVPIHDSGLYIFIWRMKNGLCLRHFSTKGLHMSSYNKFFILRKLSQLSISVPNIQHDVFLRKKRNNLFCFLQLICASLCALCKGLSFNFICMGFSFILVLHKQYTGNVLGICLYFWEEI